MSTLILCPNCESHETIVLDVRSRRDNSLRRRRQCKHCGHRFTTVEAVVEPKHGRAA